MVLDRDDWQDLVNVMTKLWVPKNGGSFSTSWGLINPSKRNLLQASKLFKTYGDPHYPRGLRGPYLCKWSGIWTDRFHLTWETEAHCQILIMEKLWSGNAWWVKTCVHITLINKFFVRRQHWLLTMSKLLHAFPLSPVRADCAAYPILCDLISLITCG